MKRILFFLVMIGLLSASLPSSIPGTGLNLIDNKTEEGKEMGYYSTDDQVTISILSKQSMSQSEWSEIEQSYISGGIGIKTDSGITYYYMCNELSDEATCFIDAYSDGIYYTIDVSMLNGTESAALASGISIGKEAMKETTVVPPVVNDTTVTPPVVVDNATGGNVTPPAVVDNGTGANATAPPSAGGNVTPPADGGNVTDVIPPAENPCMPSAILLSLLLFAFFKR